VPLGVENHDSHPTAVRLIRVLRSSLHPKMVALDEPIRFADFGFISCECGLHMNHTLEISRERERTPDRARKTSHTHHAGPHGVLLNREMIRPNLRSASPPPRRNQHSRLVTADIVLMGELATKEAVVHLSPMMRIRPELSPPLRLRSRTAM